jgi:S1-C subfamily serine protease
VALQGAGEVSAQQGVFQYRWPGPPPSGAVTVADIQQALMWTRHYTAAIDGVSGPNTRQAIAAWQAAKSYAGSGNLTPQQTVELVGEGLRQRDAYGWATLRDDALGFSVGLPTKLSKLGEPRLENGSWRYAASGAFNEFVTVLPVPSACATMDERFARLIQSKEGREIFNKVRQDDWYVVVSQTGPLRVYTRSQCRDQGIVVVTAAVQTTQADALSVLFVALANSMQLRPALNPRAQPAPRIELPAPAPGYSAAASAGPPSSQPSAPLAPGPSPDPTSRIDVERSGKTGALRLALGEGRELRPREVFERVSEAVFVVKTKERQGSAVAVSARELLTNCHVVGDQAVAVLEREGKRLLARVTSANIEADRCVLESSQPLPKWVRARPHADVKVGETAFSIGAPKGLELTIAEGIVSSKRNRNGERIVQTSAPVSHGSSGGGLFDAWGNLIGITTWVRKDAQNLNFAIAAEEFAK